MTGPLDVPAPRWFTIAAHRPFLTDLAQGLTEALAGDGVQALSEATLLLPNRRAIRGLADAFLAGAGGRAMLPPRMRALGDLSEEEPPFEPADLTLDLPPAIAPGRRRFELAGLVFAHQDRLDQTIDARAALALADALAGFLDAVQIEEVGETLDLAALAEGELARHWRKTADFLDLALGEWPRRLAELGVMDVAERRVALVRRLEARWRERPPATPLVAAGSTGSTPATAALLAAIAAAPRGLVVLPGLDRSLAETAWRAADDQHPQGALRRLLEGAGVTRSQVRPWPGSAEAVDAGRWRRRIVNEALRPAELTADWLDVISDMRAEAGRVDPFAQGLDGLSMVSARSEDEAAAIIALLLREALETPGRTAALVTPDAALARRTAARLARWNITADSSLGEPLATSPRGVLALMVARAAVDPLDPVVMLGLVKHPETRLGLEPEALAGARVALERYGLRGPRPPSVAALEQRLTHNLGERAGEAMGLAARLRAALTPMSEAFEDGGATAASAATALARSLEALTGDDGARSVWRGQAGERLAGVITGLIDDSAALPSVTASGFADLLGELLARELLRPGGASHPRLRILGVLEARLERADLFILAGLEEGLWPAGAPLDPFLSRPMRAELGLPSPDRRIGLAAHDFAQAASSPEVVLLHTERRGGSPTVQSRWLWRLKALIAGAGVAPPERRDVIAWARALDAPLVDPPPSLRTAERPAPRPPVASRPRQMSVTTVETWIRDPYAIYARRILGLRPLDPPDAAVEAQARGIALHAAMEQLARDHPGALADEAATLVEELILTSLVAAGMARPRMAREAALAATLAPWIVAFEQRRRGDGRLIVEASGGLTLQAPGGPFQLTARADRIEVRGGEADILDFKTGMPPSRSMVTSGLSPQLTLTAAILAAGGFEALGKLTPRELVYVRLKGGLEPGEEIRCDEDDAAALAADALARLQGRVAAFDDADTPYLSRAAPQFMSYAGDFDGLARLWEWGVIGEAEGGE